MARDLTILVYELTGRFPDEERFGLVSQLRRSMNSVGANLAEGAGRPQPRDRARFFGYAVASANEAEHHVIIARDVGLLSDDPAGALIASIDEVRRMAKSLRDRSLRDAAGTEV